MVGSAMKRARACWDISLESAAEALGVMTHQLRAMEDGKERPSDMVLSFYAVRFRCSLDEMKKARDEPTREKLKHKCDVRVRLGRRVVGQTERGCSFCGRAMLEVRFSVRSAAHPQARICDDCLLHCSDVVRQAIYEGSC